MHKDIRNTLVDLVIAHKLGEQPSLNTEDRNRFNHHLTTALVNNATRLHHVEALDSLKALETVPHPDTLQTALNHGIDALDTGELADLALSRQGLNSLATAIDETTPQAWHGPIKAAGLRPLKVKKGTKRA